jgi:6-phosphogluconolactonase
MICGPRCTRLLHTVSQTVTPSHMAHVVLNPNERMLVAATPAQAAVLAADQVLGTLSAEGHVKSFALSGGKTPLVLHATLRRPPYRDRVDWRRIEWLWGDERAVPPDHADSNYRMAQETLLGPLGVPPARIHRIAAERPDLDQVAAAYEQLIRDRLPATPAGVPVLDLVLMGLGNDGHTGSLLPGSDALKETQRLVVAHRLPKQGVMRVTMTYPLLKAARKVLFFVTGADKAEILAKVLAPNPSADLPAAAMRTAPGRVTWVLDSAAARLVKGASSS